MMGLTRDRKVVVGDVKRLRGRPEKIAQLVEETARGDTRRVKICMPQEPGQAGIAQVEFYTKLRSWRPFLKCRPSGRPPVGYVGFVGFIYYKRGKCQRQIDR